MMDWNATAILIAGMHRSGTSALAGALSKLSIHLGERLLEPGADNPKGYWESRDIVAVHERLLDALGSRWDDVRALPSDWLRSDPGRHAAGAIEDLLNRDFSGKSLWAIKDPRLCRLLPLWLEILAGRKVRPVVLFMVRKPSEVAASIEARNHWRSPIGEMLWLRYITEAESASRDVSRSVVLYDDLLAEPASTLFSALERVDVNTAMASSLWHDALAGFIDKNDRHHVHGSTAKGASKFAAIAEAVYARLTSIAHGRDEWTSVQEGAAEFEKYWQRDGAAIDALAAMAVRLAADAEVEWTENKELSSKLAAQIRWSADAQARYEALQADSADLTSKLVAQIRWSDDAQARQEALQAEAAELRSKLTAQIQWSEDAQARQEALQAEKAELTSELAEQTRLSADAKAQRDALRREKDDLAAELQRTISESARARQELGAKIQDSATECSRLIGDLRAANDQRVLLGTELGAVYHSISWKLTQPLRALAEVLRPTRTRQAAAQDKGHR